MCKQPDRSVAYAYQDLLGGLPARHSCFCVGMPAKPPLCPRFICWWPRSTDRPMTYMLLMCAFTRAACLQVECHCTACSGGRWWSAQQVQTFWLTSWLVNHLAAPASTISKTPSQASQGLQASPYLHDCMQALLSWAEPLCRRAWQGLSCYGSRWMLLFSMAWLSCASGCLASLPNSPRSCPLVSTMRPCFKVAFFHWRCWLWPCPGSLHMPACRSCQHNYTWADIPAHHLLAYCR